MSRTKLTLTFEERGPRYVRSLGSGVSCTVIAHPNDDTKVIKIYNTTQEAMFAYIRQRIFARKNFAPKVFERVQADFHSGTFYGFVSEKVQMFGDGDIRHHPNYNEHMLKFNKYQLGDWGNANVGIKEDKLIPIDFGLDSSYNVWKQYRARLFKLT